MVNGKEESLHKVVKQLFKKAYYGGKDPWLALLDHRDTPTEGVDASPAQRLMSRRTRTPATTLSLYSVLKSFKILHRSCCGKGKKAKFYYDRQAKQLLELEIGQEVRMSTIGYYAEITRGNIVPASRSCQTDHTSHNQVTAQ